MPLMDLLLYPATSGLHAYVSGHSAIQKEGFHNTRIIMGSAYI